MTDSIVRREAISNGPWLMMSVSPGNIKTKLHCKDAPNGKNQVFNRKHTCHTNKGGDLGRKGLIELYPLESEGRGVVERLEACVLLEQWVKKSWVCVERSFLQELSTSPSRIS